MADKEKLKRSTKIWLTILNVVLSLIIIFLVSLLIITLLFLPCSISGESMEPTLRDGQTVILGKVGKCKLNDIVVIKDVSENGNIIKRVVGVGGNRLVFRVDPDDNKHVQFLRDEGNGFEVVNEDYIRENMETNFFLYRARMFGNGTYRLAPDGTTGEALDDYAITIPEGEIFFLGDNRNNSQDSRYYGTCSSDKVVGKRVASLEGTFIQDVLELISKKSDKLKEPNQKFAIKNFQ